MDREQSPDVSNVAHLSRIAIDGGTADDLQSRFDTLIHAFQVVQSVEVPQSKELLRPHKKDELRPDRAGNSVGSSVSLKNAPQSHEGHFRVPPVLS